MNNYVIGLIMADIQSGKINLDEGCIIAKKIGYWLGSCGQEYRD